MEWAVAQDADVVSMSLGSNAAPADLQRPDVVRSAGARHDEHDPLRHRRRQHRLGQQHGLGARLRSGRADGRCGGPPGRAGVVLQPRAHGRRPTPSSPRSRRPGVGISAARSGGRGDDAYVAMSGTSMATPHVAGAAAIVKQAHPTWTGQQLKAALVSSAKSDVPGDVRAQGAGRLDVIAAVERRR